MITYDINTGPMYFMDLQKLKLQKNVPVNK